MMKQNSFRFLTIRFRGVGRWSYMNQAAQKFLLFFLRRSFIPFCLAVVLFFGSILSVLNVQMTMINLFASVAKKMEESFRNEARNAKINHHSVF